MDLYKSIEPTEREVLSTPVSSGRISALPGNPFVKNPSFISPPKNPAISSSVVEKDVFKKEGKGKYFKSRAVVGAVKKGLMKTVRSLKRLGQGQIDNHAVDVYPSNQTKANKEQAVAQDAIDEGKVSLLEGMEGGKAQSSTTRETVEYSFCALDGKEFGKDKAEPLGTRKEDLDSIKKRLKHIKEKLKSAPEGEAARLVRLKKLCEKNIESLKNRLSLGEYCGTSDIRTEVAQGTEPHDVCSSEINNCWRQSYIDPKGEPVGSFLRFGCITDRAEGLLNYQMLKEIVNSKPEDQAKIIAIEKGKIELLREKQNRKKKLNKAQEKAYDEALAALDSTSGTDGVSPVQKAFERRQFILQEQARKFLTYQIQDHGANIGKDGRLHLFQLSLLNNGVRGVDKDGLAHCEDNEVFDEAALMEELNVAEIRLDATDKPYIDTDGKYHLIRPIGLSLSSIKIATHFSNVVVQRSLKTEDKEQYAKVNKKVLEDMEQALNKKKSPEAPSIMKKFEKCQKAIQKGKVSFEIAEDFVEISKFLGWHLSINCHSGKDRTGYIAFRAIHQMVSKQIDKDLRIPLQKKIANKNFCASQFLDEDGVARSIVSKNGHLRVKINPIAVKGGTLAGMVRNIEQSAKAVIEIIQK